MRGLELKAALWNCCTKVGKATKIRMWKAERREREREREVGVGRERERWWSGERERERER